MPTTKSDMKIAFVGDLQYPYHDARALTLFMKIMKRWKPDSIFYTGDLSDQLCYSGFSDGTTDEFFNQIKKAKQEENESDDDFKKRIDPMPFIRENEAGIKKWYEDMRKQHKNAHMHVALGNHDIRIWKYIDKKAPDHIDQITPNSLWGLDDLGISWQMYDDPPSEVFDTGVFVHHGATTTTTGLAVKSDIENYNVSLVRGHDHRGGVVYKTYPMTGQTLVGMGTGHMCDPSAYGLRYTINPSWELGFGIGHVVDGKMHLQFIPISSDYVAVLDGIVFRG